MAFDCTEQWQNVAFTKNVAFHHVCVGLSEKRTFLFEKSKGLRFRKWAEKNSSTKANPNCSSSPPAISQIPIPSSIGPMRTSASTTRLYYPYSRKCAGVPPSDMTMTTKKFAFDKKTDLESLRNQKTAHLHFTITVLWQHAAERPPTQTSMHVFSWFLLLFGHPMHQRRRTWELLIQWEA